jgi:hypothetical protein
MLDADIERWNSESTMIVDSDEYKYLTSIDELINTSKEITKVLEKIRDKEYYCIKEEKGKDMCRLTEVSHRLEFSEKWIKGIYERRYGISNL